MTWDSLSDRRLFFIGRKLISEDAAAKRLALGKLGLTAKLTVEARALFAEVVRRDPSLKDKIPAANASPPAAAGGSDAKSLADHADVGFASGLAARNLSREDSRRIASIPLQDLADYKNGRYTKIWRAWES